MTTDYENLTTSDVKAICEEYRLKGSDIMSMDDEQYRLMEALQKLDTADYVMFCLYTEMASERKLAKYLKMSRTPISNELRRIKEEIKRNLGYGD